jgi:translation initiation factor IF-1
MPDATVHSDARVIEHVHGPLYRVLLPNGKAILAHLSKPLADAGTVFACDSMLRVELTPYDFDQARILGWLDAESVARLH